MYGSESSEGLAGYRVVRQRLNWEVAGWNNELELNVEIKHFYDLLPPKTEDSYYINKWK